MKKQKEIRYWFHKIFLWCFFCVPCFAQDVCLEDLRKQLDRQNIQPEELLDYLYRAYGKANDKTAMINVNNLSAATYCYMYDYEQQLHYLKNALQDVLETNNKKLEVSILYHISVTYFHLKNYTLAEEYSAIVLREARIHDPEMLDVIMILQARIEFQKGNYKHAVELNEEVIANARKKGLKRVELVCMSNIAECRIKSEQYAEARCILEKCRKEVDSETGSDVTRILRLSVTLDSLTENFKRAFYHQREVEQLTAKKYSADRLRSSFEKAIQPEMRHLDIQHSRLESVYEKQRVQLSKMNILILVLIAATSGGIVLTAYSRIFVKKTDKETDQLKVIQKSLLEKKEKLSSGYRTLHQKKDALQEEYERLIRSHRSRTELFKNISHDLQAPLVQLQQSLTKLMVSDVNEMQFRQATDGLTNSVGNMSLLLENLLQWSKYQSQDIQTKSEYIEMTVLINDAFGQQKHGASEKKVTLINALEHRLYVYADEDSIKILLKNALQNIIKLSGTNAIVSVSGNKVGNEGVICINYQGVMPLKELFLQTAETDGYVTEQSELGKAVGLGWMLCRALAKTNHGSIRIEDVAPNDFNIFLHLPLEELFSKKNSYPHKEKECELDNLKSRVSRVCNSDL